MEQDLNQNVLKKISDHRDERKVVPYIQKHEFEGLLFSDVSAFGTVMVDVPGHSMAQLGAARASFPTPEDINDNQQTAPSKRIMSMIPGYRKRLHGPLVAGEIGLTVIRRECPRFDRWIERLESLETTLQ